MTILTRGGYLINKSDLSDEQKTQIKNDLTIQPAIDRDNFVFPKPFKIYRESETRYRLPIHYGIQTFGNYTTNSMSNGVTINLSFNGSLKDNQKEPVNAALIQFKTVGGGVLSLPTGFGKTCIGLYLVSQLKVKTLIIVHKEFLMNQWKERISQFLPEAKIGIIQQSTTDVAGKDIVIGMLQSISMKNYDSNIYETFGFTIIDETHHICSRVFSKSLFNICTKYTLGLSATPHRKDGLTYVIEWFLGNIFYEGKRNDLDTVVVNCINFENDKFREPLPTARTGKVSLPIVINELVNIEERNELIINKLKELVNENRQIILLSDRRSHCEYLNEKLKEINLNSGLYIGGMKEDKLKENEKCQILCATYSLAQEGLDIPKLDTLILSTPRTDIVQACGRILRDTPGKQNNPLIIDICDKWGVLMGQANKRKKFYKNSEYNILGSIKEPESKTVSGYSFID